jgi:hypothetical protein
VLKAKYTNKTNSVTNVASTCRNQERWIKVEELLVHIMLSRGSGDGLAGGRSSSMVKLARTCKVYGRYNNAVRLIRDVVEIRRRVICMILKRSRMFRCKLCSVGELSERLNSISVEI